MGSLDRPICSQLRLARVANPGLPLEKGHAASCGLLFVELLHARLQGSTLRRVGLGAIQASSMRRLAVEH